MTNLANKDIEFLSNQELIGVLRSVLDELDVVSSHGAHRSTTYLAVSTIEGLFTEILALLKIQPAGAYVPARWPLKHKKGPLKHRDELTFEDKHQILSAQQALPSDFDKLYEPLRRFRNYIHPVLEVKKETPITQSIALMALAALNALIEKYQFRRFVASQEWKLEYGSARILADNVIDMAPKPGEVSLLVSEPSAEKFNRVKFNIFIPPGAICNIVYNYISKDQFMAARVEGRVGTNGGGLDNGRLVCKKWRDWRIIGRYPEGREPNPRQAHHTVEVLLDPHGGFDINVDNQQLQLADGATWEFAAQGQVGFMTEEGPVSISDLNVEVG